MAVGWQRACGELELTTHIATSDTSGQTRSQVPPNLWEVAGEAVQHTGDGIQINLMGEDI